jgi:hypothetical protein
MSVPFLSFFPHKSSTGPVIKVGAGTSSLITALIPGQKLFPSTYEQNFFYGVFKSLSGRFSPNNVSEFSMHRSPGFNKYPRAFGRFFLPLTEDVYIAACKKRGLKPKSIVLEDGTTAFWLGSSTAKKAIFNLHGAYPL